MIDEKKFKAAAVQLSPVLFDRDGTTEKVLKCIEKCGSEDIRLAVFPETVIPNYPYFALVDSPLATQASFEKLYLNAVDVPGPVTAAVGTAAKKSETVVVLGVNERDGGTLYNTQLIFDADGTLLGKRRKIMPTYHERMIWGWGDGSGLNVFQTAVGRIGALICWEHYMPLARYALIAQKEQIHCSHFPGSMGGSEMAGQLDAAVRHHAMESGAFVVNATAWLDENQRMAISPDELVQGYLKGGLCTAVVSPDGRYLAGPLPEGEDMAVAEIDLASIISRKSLLDTAGHYSRPDILQLWIDKRGRQNLVEAGVEEEKDDDDPSGETLV
ncbi:MAG: nitrilase-related carbon-nitrogen hydrolase [Desulfobacterales bacterium]